MTWNHSWEENAIVLLILWFPLKADGVSHRDAPLLTLTGFQWVMFVLGKTFFQKSIRNIKRKLIHWGFFFFFVAVIPACHFERFTWKCNRNGSLKSSLEVCVIWIYGSVTLDCAAQSTPWFILTLRSRYGDHWWPTGRAGSTVSLCSSRSIPVGKRKGNWRNAERNKREKLIEGGKELAVSAAPHLLARTHAQKGQALKTPVQTLTLWELSELIRTNLNLTWAWVGSSKGWLKRVTKHRDVRHGRNRGKAHFAQSNKRELRLIYLKRSLSMRNSA